MISSGSNGDTKTDGNAPQGDCGRYAALLTAYFDGEATTEEARAARSHLEMCSRCAHAWTAWGRARRLLRALPVPTTPPNLLARIVFACRLSALPLKSARRSIISEPEYSGANEFDRRTLSEVPFISMEESALSDAAYEAPVIMPGDLPPVVPPAHLHDAILRLTIGADGQKLNKTERAEFIATEMLYEDMVIEEPVFLPLVVDEVRPAPARRSSLSELATGRARAWGQRSRKTMTALAVPAIAAWLMIASDFSGQLTQTAQRNQEPANVTTNNNEAASNRPAPAASSGGESRLSFLQRSVNQGKKQIAAIVSPRAVAQDVVPSAPVAKASVPQENGVMALPAAPASGLPMPSFKTVSLLQSGVYTPRIDWQPVDLRPNLEAKEPSPLTAASLPPVTDPKPTMPSASPVRLIPAPVARSKRQLIARASRVQSVDLPSKVVFTHASYEQPARSGAGRAPLMTSLPPVVKGDESSSNSSGSTGSGGTIIARLDPTATMEEMQRALEIRDAEVTSVVDGLREALLSESMF